MQMQPVEQAQPVLYAEGMCVSIATAILFDSRLALSKPYSCSSTVQLAAGICTEKNKQQQYSSCTGAVLCHLICVEMKTCQHHQKYDAICLYAGACVGATSCLQGCTLVTLGAVLDLLVCIAQRTFSRRAEAGQFRHVLAYILWLMVCKLEVGTYTFPCM